MKKTFIIFFLLVQLSIQGLQMRRTRAKKNRGRSLRGRGGSGGGRVASSRGSSQPNQNFSNNNQQQDHNNRGNQNEFNDRMRLNEQQNNNNRGYQNQFNDQTRLNEQQNNNNRGNQNEFTSQERTYVKSTAPSNRYRPTIHYATEAVISNYDNIMLQINMQRSDRFNTSLTKEDLSGKFNTSLANADFFVHKGGVYGFEWKNGMFIRQPFPTFQKISDEFNNRIKGTALFVPLHNRYKSRKALINQMDCALHMKIIEHTHFFHRFNRIILQFSTPCRSDILEVVLLNRAGLRKIMRLTIGSRQFLINFRGVIKSNYLSNLEKESYSEYRLASPQHLGVNYLRKKYLNDFRKPGFEERITPEILMAHEEAILNDMEAYYNKNEEVIKSLESGNEVNLSENSIEQNTQAPSRNSEQYGFNDNNRQSGFNDNNRQSGFNDNNRQSGSNNNNRQSGFNDNNRQSGFNDNNRQSAWSTNSRKLFWNQQGPFDMESQERSSRWGMNTFEISKIQQFLSKLRMQSKEVLNMCKNICTMDSYYPSWDFCRETCNINTYFLSNDDSREKDIQYLHKVRWNMLNGKYLQLTTGKRRQPYWTVADIERIWNAPPVITCRQTWTTFNCSI